MNSQHAMLSKQEIEDLVWSNAEKVFSTMLAISLKCCSPDEEQIKALRKGGVISLVGFAGAWRGCGSIRCSGRLACLLSEKLLLTHFDHVNDEVLDAMGEIANMIIGNFKDDASYKLGPIGLSTPTVIYGNNFETRKWNAEESLAVLLDCEGELLEINVSLIPGQRSNDVSQTLTALAPLATDG